MKILAVLLISAFALRVAPGIALTMPALADAYESPSYSLSNAISECTYRGGGRREDCLYLLR